MLPTRVLRYGTDTQLPERIPLRAGPLDLVYENGDLRSIRLGGHELVRRIYVAVRDRNWGTVPPTLANLVTDIAPDSFRITYDVTHHQGGIDFFWRGVIVGDASGTIRFGMDGEARSSFLRNRIGFCVLHPICECAGARAQIEHLDRTVEDDRFPQLIAPQAMIDGIIQPVHPFSEMQRITYKVAPDVWADVRFEGETFEMEDQRNWTDGSFKTYGTPLRLPFPVEIAPGTPIVQSVTLRVDDRRGASMIASASSPMRSDVVTCSVQRTATPLPLPQIGLGVASHGQPLDARELERLRALRLGHLRVDLRLYDADYPHTLAQATAEARAIDALLEVALHLSDSADAELTTLAALLPTLNPPVHSWLVFHRDAAATDARWVVLARQQLGEYDPTALIGGGTNLYFTDLNRERPSVDASDVVCYSINPQVHAFDNASLAETCEASGATVRTAQQLAAGHPIAVTPVTLKARFNPLVTGPEPELLPGALPPPVDARQMSLFGASWTLGSLKYLAESGATSVTYYETTGWRGVMETAAGSPLPDVFQSIPGGVFPLYHVLADVGAFAGGQIVPAVSSNTLQVECMALHQDGRMRVLLGSFQPEPQQVVVDGLGGWATVRILDETNADYAMRQPEAFRGQSGTRIALEDGKLELTLGPYALACINSE